MKIRIKGNSIRMRLTRSEVESFGKEGYLEERTEFGDKIFIYALAVKTSGNELSATFAGEKITMYVPVQMVSEWTTTDKVGYDNVMAVGDGKSLSLLLEKDFKCIDDNVLENQDDNYENPLTICE
jgi:hypothetical protein